MSAHRLPAPWGTRLDRAARVPFSFDGRDFEGFAGDTLASALLANGVRLTGRSFKYHRPRGVFAAGVEETSTLVDVGEGAYRSPNENAATLELVPGLTASSVNRWPSLRFDFGAINARLAAVLPAGFYYKTFKWPDWHWYEPSIRRMAGLGRVANASDPDRYEEIAVEVDVLVVGAGLAGLCAARAAAEAGARVRVLAAGPQPGGALAYRDPQRARELAASAERAGARIATRTLAFGVYDHGLVCAREKLVEQDGAQRPRLRERLWKIRARAVIAATGAFERPMVFPDNDRPGVMLAGAVEEYARAFGVACGRRVVVAANCDSAYDTARSLREAGMEVVAVVDRRREAERGRDPGPGTRVIAGAGLSAVFGRNGVSGCSVRQDAAPTGRAERLDCDLIASAGGFAPAVHLHSHAGGRLRWLDAEAMFVPDGPAGVVVSVGACAGVFDATAAAEHAELAGRALARGERLPPWPAPGIGRSLAHTALSGARGKQFVDLQNDVDLGDVALAARENYRSVEHLKRYTTTGMGTDQGKTSNVNALVALGEFSGREPAAVGTTTFRPPFVPVTLGTFVGRRTGALYRPLKRLPAEAWHVERGALFEQFGNWWRPAAYPQPGEDLHAAAQREAAAVRRGAGLMDGSPLGKLDVFGPDAAAFLDLMYVGTVSTLKAGQARYGVVLNEHGVVMDDGIVARLADNRFWVNTTSAGVERTAAAFEEWLQCEYPQLRLCITPVTSHYGNVTVAGPRAWAWLASIGFDAALAPKAMRHMTLREATWEGTPLKVMRASFCGELSYEINLPVDRTRALLDRLWARAAEFEAVPYGIEALEILRTEKGYLHVGTDTDGTTLPGDIGMARGVERKAANFVGRRSLLRPAALDPNRFVLVALDSADGRTLLPVGAQIAPEPPPTRTQGHVTSSYFSPTLGRPVALAMLERGGSRVGERIKVHHLGRVIEAVVTRAPFVDPEGRRIDGEE